MNQYPMNDLRNPLGKAFYDLTQQVEALGGSPELTAVVVAIGALRDQVGAALATKPQAGEQKPVASIYISPNGEREFDDWRHDLPVGRNELYTAPQPEQVAQDKIDAERWRAFIGLEYRVRAEWACNLSLVPVLTEWVDQRAARARGEGERS